MRPQNGVRATTLVIVALAVALVAGVVLRLTDSVHSTAGSLGPIGAVVMAFLAFGLLVLGWQVRQTRDGKADRPVSALRAARTLVLGQAGALTGAALVGWYGIQAALLAPSLDVPSQASAFWRLVAHAVLAALLAVAGMVVQSFCRITPGGRDDDPDSLGA